MEGSVGRCTVISESLLGGVCGVCFGGVGVGVGLML